MHSFHLAHNCLVIPLLDEVCLSGVNTSKLIRKSGLKQFNLTDPDGYIPLSLYYNLLHELKQLGIDNFAEHFNHVQKVRNLGFYGEQVLQIPSLFEASMFAVKFNHLVLSNEVIRININGPKTTCEVVMVGQTHSAWDLIELLTTIQLIDAVRMAVGQDWVPDELHLRNSNYVDLSSIFNSRKLPNIRFGQDCTRLVFDTNILNNKIQANSGSRLFEHKNIKSFSDKVVALLESANSIPSLPNTADYFGTSVSSFKRLLKSEHNTYFKLIDSWRFKTAIDLIEKPAWQVNEISQYLKFANSSNFSRAFRRWTGVYPEAYRAQL